MSESLRIIYMGSPDFAVPPLRALAEAGYKPLAVVTRPDKPRGRGGKLSPTPVKQAAQEMGLPVLTPPRVNAPEALAEISAFMPDLLLTVAFGQILKEGLLQLPRLGAVNLHASMLPAYRGAAPIHRAVMNGERASGVCSMYMDEGLDTGDIILKAHCEIGVEETAGELHDKLMLLGAELLCRTVKLIELGQAPRLPQDDAGATYAPPLNPEDEIVNWQQSAAAIHNQIRGLNPWPVAYSFWGGRRVKLWRCHIRPARFAAKPGSVVAVDRQGIWLATGDGELCLTEMQPEGKSPMEGCAFARGYGIEPGVEFG
jgi:methionyl-tRNA formyltransferase